MNIHQRLNAVRKALGDGYMQKDTKVAGAGGGYRALTYDKLIRYVRPHLLEHGVMAYPELIRSERHDGVTKNGAFVLRYSAVYMVRYVNEDDPHDVVSVTIEADANDSGDKASPKALTVALRLAHRSVLNIETGEDEEQRGEELAQAQDVRRAPDGEPVPTLADALEECGESVLAIKAALDSGDDGYALQCWDELTKAQKMALWVAPSKGGPFSTAERTAIHALRAAE